MEDDGKVEAIQIGGHRAYRWRIASGYRVLWWPFRIDIESRCIDAYRLGYYDLAGVVREVAKCSGQTTLIRDLLLDAQRRTKQELPSNVTWQHYLLYTGEPIALNEAMAMVAKFVESLTKEAADCEFG